MRINHNISALNSYRQLTFNNLSATRSLEKLSSGLRINKAADDAAGLAISEKMRGQIRGLDQAVRNSQDAISLIQTAEGALNETHYILQRMRELAVQASSDSYTDVDRNELQKEIDQLIDEIDRISNTTEFNTKKLIDGSRANIEAQQATAEVLGTNTDKFNLDISSFTTTAVDVAGTYLLRIENETSTPDVYNYKIYNSKGGTWSTGTININTATFITISTTANVAVTFSAGTLETGDSISIILRDAVTAGADNSLVFQIGSNSSQTMKVDINDMDSESLHVKGIKINTQTSAEAAISTIEQALRYVSAERSKLGAFQNRLEHTINNLSMSSENLTAAESRIRDVDMAKEMMEYTKNTILQQAATSMLAQANQQPQNVLQLLR
ncbi:MAG: flagellin [Thermosipho sp. (in: Bacteria)]|nr:flagellin [Thermosipho sp. (in: thermotogales)]